MKTPPPPTLNVTDNDTVFFEDCGFPCILFFELKSQEKQILTLTE